MGKIYKNGVQYSGSTNVATNINYDNTIKKSISASNVQGAIDELTETTSQSKNITQEEYNALPDTKYTDNIEYFITDADPLTADTISYDDTETSLGASVQDAITSVNTKLTQCETELDDLTTPVQSTSIVDLSSYTSTPYTCTSDGYLFMVGSSSSSATHVNIIMGDGTSIVWTKNVTTSASITYVKKGMKLQVVTLNGTARFYPFGY